MMFALLLAAAQDDALQCTDVAFGAVVGEVRLAQVTVPQAGFTEEPKPAKPGARPYLVRGDTVLIGPAKNGFVAAVFPAGKGLASGCLQLSQLRLLPAPPAPKPAKWLGNWSGIHGPCCSADITIRPRGREVALEGSATWMDPKNPMGMRDNEIGGSGVIRGTRLSTRDSGGCDYEMQLLGPYLIVGDARSEDCFPSNASFSGIYRR